MCDIVCRIKKGVLNPLWYTCPGILLSLKVAGQLGRAPYQNDGILEAEQRLSRKMRSEYRREACVERRLQSSYFYTIGQRPSHWPGVVVTRSRSQTAALECSAAVRYDIRESDEAGAGKQECLHRPSRIFTVHVQALRRHVPRTCFTCSRSRKTS